MAQVYIYTLSTKESPDNIRYVGYTQNPSKRIKRHINKYYLNQKDHKARWLKKVIEEGQTPILEIVDVIDKNDWEFWEQYWICQFRGWGFNLTNLAPGGNGGFQKGHLNTFYGKKHSPEVLKIIQNSAPKKAVCMYSKQGNILNEFISIREATKKTGISRTHISRCCNNQPGHNTAGGFVFKFKGDVFELKKPKLNYKPIIQKDKSGNIIRQYESLSEASRQTGIPKNSIGSCVSPSGKCKTVHGFIFEYI